MRNINRGNIYYIEKYPTIGSEQQSGRPAIIVSNEANNRNSETVEIVYLTTQQKTTLPTHVSISSAQRLSTALCEQVTSVSVNRLGDFIGRLTDREMTQIDTALLISLDLSPIETGKERSKCDEEEDPAETAPNVAEDITSVALKTERDTYKEMYESLLEKILGGVRV